MNPELIITTDGSHTIYVKELDEHYHSVNGAITESVHVFINCGLRSVLKKEINILEIGFGTGLNCLLTVLNSEKSDKRINYIALEKYPLEQKYHYRLNYCELLNDSSEIYSSIIESNWESINDLTPGFSLGKFCSDLINEPLPTGFMFDLIYFDAFAPSKQPEMWTTDVFLKISERTAPGGIFVTYCAKGEVRRNLEKAGFRMERLPGPPGKREILRGIKIFPSI